MDILCIRGQNIASLAKPFEIDLENGQLSGCGLFAIIGNTGAGKSSLLDAMCLALYNECPRLGATGVNDQLPDSSGEMLQSNDPRTILRRGTAEGFASVRFRGRDGIDYEASWGVRRARGSATGRLQAVDRSLTRLSDGQVIENQIRKVNEAVTDLTGLTYHEFRRSVLLAQGDFDSFLAANTAQRASILEKVTGTGLYREISRRIYARTQEAQNNVNELETRLGEHTVLSDEDLGQMRDRLKELAILQEATTKSLASVMVGLEHYKALKVAETRLLEARQKKQLAEKAWLDASDERAYLNRLHKAVGVRAEFQEDRDARNAKCLASEALTLAKHALGTSVSQETSARDAHENAQTLVDELEAQFSEMGPVWSQAERLDAEITTAMEEHRKAETAHQDQLDKLAEKRVAIEEDTKARHRIQSERDRNQEKIDAVPGARLMVEQWSSLEDLLKRRIAAAGKVHEASETIARIDQEQKRSTERAGEITLLLAEKANARKKLEGSLEGHRKVRGDLAAKDPSARLGRLISGTSTVGSLIDLAQRYARGVSSLSQNDTQLKAAEDGSVRASDELKTEIGQRDTAAVQIKALEQPTEIAEAAVSSEAQALRRHLIDGQPCPVCQSTEHPVHAEGPAAEIAQRLRVDLEAARKERDRAGAAIVEAQSRQSSLTQQAAELRETRQSMIEGQEAIRRDYAALVEGECGGPIEAHLPMEIEGSVGALTSLRETMADWRRQLEQDQSRLAELQKLITSEQVQLQEIDWTTQDLRNEAQAITEAASTSTRERDRVGDAAEAARQGMGEIDTALTSRFSELAMAWTVFDKEGASQLTQLDAQRLSLDADMKQIAKADTDLADADRKLEIAQSQLTDLGAAVDKAKGNLDARAEALKSLRETRGGLLDGQPTGAHRTAFNARRRAAIATRDSASITLAGAVAKRAAAESSVVSAGQTLETAGTRLTAAEENMSSAEEKTGLSAMEIGALLAEDGAKSTELEARIEALKTERSRVSEAVTTREGDLAAIKKAKAPEETEEALTVTKTELDAAIEERRNEKARIDSTLQVDAEARKRQEEILRALDKAQSEQETWAAVNDVVGSSSGDKFSQIAQEVTLAILVEQANHHLQDIKPRYRLAQSVPGQVDSRLSLYVIDDDMAGEIRSTRSLSGGERFLVSLALALALSSVGGAGVISGTLFIDEGFGTLDTETLEVAIDTLETLQAQGRTVGVISHVEGMKDRIPMQVRIEAQGDGASEVVIEAA